MLDERGGIPPFGWAVACVGRRPDEVGEDVRALVERSAALWKRHFPPERGYQVCVESAAGTARGVHMMVRRGDFRASATIERASELRGGHEATPVVRAFGRGRSDTLHHAHELGERAVQRGRTIGAAVGFSLFLSLAWLMIGVNDPIYVLGGLLLVVALLLTLTAGATLGTWFGERLAELYQASARRQVQGHQALQEDIRRWKGLQRNVVALRTALTTRRGGPFRSDPRVLAS